LIAAQNARKNRKPHRRLLVHGSARPLDAVGGEFCNHPIFAQAPRSIAWLEAPDHDPELRQRWIDIFAKLTTISAPASPPTRSRYWCAPTGGAAKLVNSERPAIRCLLFLLAPD